MPKRSESLKIAQIRYLERIKTENIPQWNKIRTSKLESSKRAFNRRYANDEEFRKNKVKYGIEAYYYRSAEESSLKCVRKLFGDNQFYGR